MVHFFRCVAGCPPNSSTGQAQLETALEITSIITVSLADLYYGLMNSPRITLTCETILGQRFPCLSS